MQYPDEHKNIIYRYPGVQPFKTSESEIFFGREKDKDAFYNFMLSRQMVVLYGKSGYGKSSLINAGIIPRLQLDSSNIYFIIRFNNYQPNDPNSIQPVASLNQRIFNELSKEQWDNPLLNEITGNEKTLWYWLKQIQKYKQARTVFLFFDQFEELFTYPPEQINTFSEQLADAIYTAVPVKYRNTIAEKEETLLAAIEETKNEEEKRNLEEELDWLFQKPQVKIILSIRSDRMSLLNQINDRHVSILANCYELLPLSEDDARDAIIKPAGINSSYYTAPAFTYAPGLIDNILESFRRKPGETIETNILQIICRYIEESLVIEMKKTYILPEDVGEISNVLYKYYENILNKLDNENRHKAQQLVEEKLITANQRNALSEAYIKKEFNIDDKLLETLETSSLLRKERDASGRLLYEISHDTLIEPIQKLGETRLKKEEEDKKAALREQIRVEQKRVSDLKVLNQKVRTRSWIAFATALFGIVAAIIAFNSSIKANKAKLESDSSRLRVLETLKNLSFQKAMESYTKGNQFLEYQEDSLAYKAFKDAQRFLDTSIANQESKIPDNSVTNLSFNDLKDSISQKISRLHSTKPLP
jgi:hypothetical protein